MSATVSLSPVASVHTPSIFTVTSDGRNTEMLIRDLERKGSRVSGRARGVMEKPQFVTTTSTTYLIDFILGDEFSNDERTTRNIRKEAKRRGWLPPLAEVAPLAREKLSDGDIEYRGFRWLVIMHEPINSDGGPRLLGLNRSGVGQWLDACLALPGRRWNRGHGFGFLHPAD